MTSCLLNRVEWPFKDGSTLKGKLGSKFISLRPDPIGKSGNNEKSELLPLKLNYPS